MSSRPRISGFAVLATLLAGCGKGSVTPAKPLAGSYALIGVNGIPIPSAGTIDSVSRTFVSGTLVVTDSTYGYFVCAQAIGNVDATCGVDELAFSDSGLVWWSPRGPSFVGRASHISRALAVTGSDTLTFARNDIAAPLFTFAR